MSNYRPSPAHICVCICVCPIRVSGRMRERHQPTVSGPDGMCLSRLNHPRPVLHSFELLRLLTQRSVVGQKQADVYVCVCVHVCMHAYACVRVHVCVCVCVCVCV